MSARASIHAMFQLDEIASAELDRRLNALIVEALLKAGVEYVDCPVCGAAQAVGKPCDMCAFKASIAAELAARGLAVTEAEGR
jgi:predicted hydrocarbon binding protein